MNLEGKTISKSSQRIFEPKSWAKVPFNEVFEHEKKLTYDEIFFKILTVFVAVVTVPAVLLGIWNAMRPPEDGNDGHEPDATLTAQMIGTWRGVENESRIYVFREDGTGLGGILGTMYEFTWYMDGNELHSSSSSSSTSYSLEDGILIVERRPIRGRPYTRTYVFYSAATDLYERDSRLFNFVILPALGSAALFLIWRAVSKRIKPRQRLN